MKKVDNLIYQYKGGEDDGYGGKTDPITWKEAYEEQIRYESWAMKEMRKACDKIKAHPEWKYGKNAYPSPYERAIVAGCQQAVKQLQEEIVKLKKLIFKFKSNIVSIQQIRDIVDNFFLIEKESYLIKKEARYELAKLLYNFITKNNKI